MLLRKYLSVKIDIHIHFLPAKLQELQLGRVEANSESRVLHHTCMWIYNTNSHDSCRHVAKDYTMTM